MVGFGRDKGAADFLTLFRTDGDILHVRIGTAQPPGGGDRLIERGVDTVGFRADSGGEFVDVGIFEFSKFAVFEHEGGNGVEPLEGFEDFLVGGLGFLAGTAAFGGFNRAEGKFVKKDIGKLLGGIDIKDNAGLGMDFGDEFFEAAAGLVAEFFEPGDIEGDAAVFHVGQNEGKGHFDMMEQFA